ncbi:polyprenol phosphomannose-dependent alpha 1,6 mannosyltransferase MptB [Nigerium massiliense]|uniref:polyprenol phosphomannose-dependent alpha 1,6 mannosyltransferase MptB n=1 Tax=Nigerium massiliense TaxID=1522317 RepID=UPI0011C7D3CC|nr:polyprenol phosphomannose-dependent alpha 1,6 mannosyltransferase MptB [Nigerium massiliense]
MPAPRVLTFTPAAALGFLATAMVALGGCANELSFSARGWPNPVVQAISAAMPVPLNRVLIIAGCALLAYVWWRLHPREDAPWVARPGLLLALWSIPLLLVPPALSGDPILYADSGYMLSQGHNTYIEGLTSAGGPFAPYVDKLWAGHGVAYPPLTMLVNEAVVVATGAHPYWSVVAMRVPALIGVALLGFSIAEIARLAGRSVPHALWWGLLNPLLVVHFVGGAHNDALMAGVSLFAIYTVVRFPTVWARWIVAPVLVGLAMALKQQAGLTVLAVAGWPVLHRLRSERLALRLWILGSRSALAAVIAVVVFALVTLASGLGLGWTKWLTLMGAAGTVAPFALLGDLITSLTSWTGLDPQAVRLALGMASNVTLLAVLVWILVRWSNRPVQATGWASFAIAVLGQALHPWYLPWSLALLGLDKLSRRQTRVLFWFVALFVVWNAIQTSVWHTTEPGSRAGG